MRSISRHFVPLVARSAWRSRRSPATCVSGTLARRARPALLWGGLVRIFFVHHVTWSVNSVCHFLGTRRFDTDDRLDQRLLAGAALARRVLAPQPPRLPALRRSWPGAGSSTPRR